ncbi:MAG TPA: hypothetical protein VNZ58_12470 [Thermomicrobiales bacterium]|nr:hypothetical protein [Thermomicrobiales bacterium]
MVSFSDIRMDRRRFALATSAVALVGLPQIRPILAQESAPGDLASLGLPELNLTVGPDSFDGLPEGDLPAGRYLLTATIADGLEYGSASIIGSPPGMSSEDFLAALAGVGGGPPDAAPEGSPVAGEEDESFDMEVPLFLYMAPFPGGVGGPGGTVAQGILDLPPGEWILWGDDPAVGQVPVIFNVTGEMPSDLPEPDADVTITFIDFAISVDGNLTAGDHLAHIQNHGAQPHFVVIMKGPDTMTNDDIATLVQAMLAPEGGEGAKMPELPELPFNPDTDLIPVFQTVQQSIATNLWMPLSLDAGTYAGLCFFPTAGEGLPHAVHGMHTVFTVA